MEIDPGPQPPSRRGPSWISPRLVGVLAAVLVILVAVALVLPDLLPGDPGGTAAPGGTAVAGSPGPSPSRTFVRPTPTPQPTPLTYFVKSGDSLISIALEFGTTVRSIGFWNRDRYPTLDPEAAGFPPNLIGVGWTFSIIPKTVFDEDAPPSPSPSGAPTPSPSAPATPIPVGPAVVLSHGPRGTDQVALTLDMGERLDPAVEIMDWLVEHRVKATIFATGSLGSTTDEGRQVLQMVRDHPDLFDLGNHSWDDPSFTELTAAQMSDQLWTAEGAIAPLSGQTTQPWFRPPLGAWTNAVRDGVGAAGWRYLVMWDIDTADWRPTADGGPTTADIEAKVLANAEGGSIVLMRLGGWHTLEALPGIVDGLQAKGLRPVTLAEMVGN